MPVPNQKPTKRTQFKMAIIGEAPGEQEEAYGKPFIGASGRYLEAMLRKNNLSRDELFIGNVCQTRPPENNIKAFKWDGPEIKEGLERLKADLADQDITLFFLVGKSALQAAGVDVAIGAYRGTVFRCTKEDSPFYGRKCVASFHPAYIIRGNSGDSAVFEMDLRKAKANSVHDDILLTKRTYQLDLSCDQIVESLERIEREGSMTSVDIEGYVTGVTCVGIATSHNEAFIVPFYYGQYNCWTVEEEMRIWAALSRMLMNPHVPKILQNSLYDRFVLAYGFRIVIVNVVDDTMLKHWELYPEFEKGLTFQTTHYTDHPYYKDGRKAQTKEGHWEYCCTDAAITHEINDKQSEQLYDRDPGAMSHYQFNMDMLNPLLFMELKGIRYDSLKCGQKILACQDRLGTLQAEIDAYNGGPLNTSSSKQMKEFLYGKMALPVKYNRGTGKETTNYEAVLSLYKATNKPVLAQIIEAKQLRTVVQMLNIRTDIDGRVRCGYNIVGTNTGRLTCYTSPTGSGYNLQTIPQLNKNWPEGHPLRPGMRDLFLADPDYYFFQCDLSGADAWTVAAWCKALGDPTMMDDLLYGIKIAKVIACMFRFGPSVARLPRPELKAMCDKIDKEDPIYFGSKCVQHGTNYGAGHVTVAATIFTMSEGQVQIPSGDCKTLATYYTLRYPGLLRWHAHTRGLLASKGFITSASGHTRVFYGNRTEHDVFKQALADEPQENTTYATNFAAHRLWNDPLNRWGSLSDSSHPLHGLVSDGWISRQVDTRPGSLIVEPLHQVHDALCGQFPIRCAMWAVNSINEWFRNELTIAGQKITIPFEGGYGPSWGELTVGTI